MSCCIAPNHSSRRKYTGGHLRQTRNYDRVLKANENHCWCSYWHASLYASHDALVCRGEVAAKHQDCFERVDWGVRNIRNGIRRSLGVSQNGVEGALQCHYLVKLIV